ncbi:LLM class flavin-dependent oxidoreductase [Nocardioides sp. InS609-2]|uniref:LLM class flavin-dependent oxidoreductase n=1 Tax=Nocardioides sp. InS609-2 TaxID=2760705 RepID=UPI0020BE44C8|nr:LLM class flavin-dependent oxidoreductase [Nocardioides sp. InS609-2]
MIAGRTHVDVSINPRGIARTLEEAEALVAWGAARLSVWDSPSRYSDCWTTLGALSQHVTTRPLGVGVTNPLTRHPLVTASAIASVHDASPAGAFLGVGTGDSGVVNLGRRRATLADLEEYVCCVRSLLHHDRAHWRGQELCMERPGTSAPPIYLAAHGPRSLALAARIADGAIVGIGFDRTSVDLAHPIVSDAAPTRADDLPELDLWWNAGGIVVDHDEERAVVRAGWLAAWAAHHLVNGRAGLASIPEGLRAGVRELADSYDLGNHGMQSESRKRRYLDVARSTGAWGYLGDRFLVAGTPDRVRSRLEELR